MIDFRYHLVSIVAVFLALGLGLLLGATALQPSTLAGIYKTSQRERQQIASLITANGQLNHQISSNDQFAQANAPQMLRQLLAGERVVVVEAPGAPGQVVTGIDQALTEAGATISGHVQIQSRFFDVSPATQEQLTQRAQQFAPAGLTLHGSPVAQASRVLADAILTKDGPGEPVAGQLDSASAALLSGFGAGGFLTRSGHPETRATLSVVVTPQSPSTTSDSNPASQRLVTLAQALNLVGAGTVMAGPVTGSGPGSAIDVVRSGKRPSRISTVDNADHSIGQIVVAQALYEQLHGITGNYGSTSTAAAPGPSPAPTSAPTPSAGLPTTASRPSPQAAPTGRAGRS